MSLFLGQKDKRIYIDPNARRCLDRLGLKPQDCIHCGDGGSREPEVSGKLGMKPVQALWYLWDGYGQPAKRMPEYVGAESPPGYCEAFFELGR